MRVPVLIAALSSVAACGGAAPAPPAQSGGTNTPPGATLSEGSSPGTDESEYGGDGDCGWVVDETVTGLAPVDIIVVVDNSGSMQFEEAAVQASINDFSEAIANVDIDVQVILVSNYNICVPPPLGSGDCAMMMDSNPPAFTHIDYAVASNNALYILSATLPVVSTIDSLLRENSVKHVLVVTDDESLMSAAEFDTAFRGLGAKYENYRFHAIAASEGPDTPPCVDLSSNQGAVYMELVELREGVFGDLCGQDFSPVFDALAEEVVLTTPAACSWPVPSPPPGEVLNAEAVEVQLVVDGQEEALMRVENELACDGGDGWYFTPSILDPQDVSVCPETCTRIQSANAAQVDISFPCELPPEHED